MDAYAGCMYYNTNEFEMCRKEQQEFEKACPYWLAGNNVFILSNNDLNVFATRRSFCCKHLLIKYVTVAGPLSQGSGLFDVTLKLPSYMKA